MKTTEPCIVLSNKNYFCRCESPSGIPGHIFSAMGDHIKWASIENLKEKLSMIGELCVELFDRGSSAPNRALKTLKNISKITDKDQMIAAIYNTILAAEGKGLLPGFGYATGERDSDTGKMKAKHHFPFNAEKISILKVGNI